jgi:hypothetical protein
MNQKIRELAEQADCKIDRLGYGEGDLEKFAELIVGECVEVVKWTPSLFSNDEYVKNIKTHFGVEE